MWARARFQPIKVEDYRQHPMHAEWGQLVGGECGSHSCLQARRGGRVVAVGTTVVRVLETAAASGSLNAWSGDTRLFIYPPYAFRVVAGLVTNFHLPRSTLLLLAGAFAGGENLERAYKTAIADGYRFYKVMAMRCWCCELAVL